MEAPMGQDMETQNLSEIAQMTGKFIAAVEADYVSGQCSRYQVHLIKFNKLILSLFGWPQYADYSAIPDIPRHAAIPSEERSKQEKSKLAEILSKARLLRDALNEIYCNAQICLSGHVQHCGDVSFDSKAHCTICGVRCVDQCAKCEKAIRGVQMHKTTIDYLCPQYCHACGHPYPWMEERLHTALDLLRHDDKLTEEDREDLWPDLKYVMSDPKADLVKAKKKLITIKLDKALPYTREFILDYMAKVTAETMKNP